jgi:CheY-like chemotaxis protein
MANKNNSLSSRDAKVIMVMHNEEDSHGASIIISQKIPDYRAIIKDDNTDDFIKEKKPTVILLSLENVDKCIEYYSYLVEGKYLEHIHYAILLCKNKESSIAFHCCMQGLFDNYFVYQPLYEKFRLLLIISSGLAYCESKTLSEHYRKEQFEDIDKELDLLITQGSQCKLELMEQINQSKNDFEAMQELINSEEESNRSKQEIMELINEGHVQPLLNHLQKDITSSLEDMLTELLQSKNKAHEFSIQSLEPLMKPASLINEPLKQDLDISVLPDIKFELNNIEEIPKVEQRQSILIVEDNKIYRQMLEAILLKENYKIEIAEDGLCALKKIKNHVYDLIIMDLFMPNLDGLNTTKKIRSIPSGKNVPVIALTGNKNKQVVQQWANYGLKGYILKPSTRKEILLTINKVLYPKG